MGKLKSSIIINLFCNFQVGFYKDKEVRKIRVAKRDNVIINRLNKTKREAKLTTEEFRAEREKRDKLERDEKKKVFKQIGMISFFTYMN